jgi:DNA-binding MarR family transcriptional regulator
MRVKAEYPAPAANDPERPEVLQAWTELCEVVDRGRLAVSRALQREAGLTLAENLVLCQVAMAPGTQLQMVALARVLGVGKSAVTKTVDRLEERGWVSRQRDSEDRRAVRAALTPAGREAFARAQPVYAGAVARFLTGPLSDPQLREFHRLLGQINADAPLPPAGAVSP